MQEKSLIKKNILQFIDYKDISKYKFYKETGITRGVLDQNNGMSEENTARFLAKYPEINPDWLLTGKGEMLKATETSETSNKKNMIPFYEDVETIGGNNLVANVEPTYNTSLFIDAGDWFSGATAAIRHYNDSMIEYPSGCILAIKKINDKNEIVWGRNYVIETAERRITKQIAELDEEHIICYSTNTETHFDGRPKHQPITIRKEDIVHIFRVLGSVNKEESTGIVKLL